ncbi:hypothetical protein SAMN05216412_104241 [Nitrosospira multiformis]|uniref:Uncharacterized protein n=2 Tax=Nitrosospira multiformis TaxID=1231 RepID=A0A1I0D3Y4_9PROT|nr:hypothetical protein SAMN05216412_104241 [Nitrosospira multiformis]
MVLLIASDSAVRAASTAAAAPSPVTSVMPGVPATPGPVVPGVAPGTALTPLASPNALVSSTPAGRFEPAEGVQDEWHWAKFIVFTHN